MSTPQPVINPMAAITTGKVMNPIRIVVYGVDGVGKSTFAADAPDNIFICAERGTDDLDVSRFPAPANWLNIIQILDYLASDENKFKSVTIDSIDWFEDFIKKKICAENGWNSIEDPGYGRGWKMMREEFRDFLISLDYISISKNMNVIIIGHTRVEKYNDPEHDPYDRFHIKLDDENAAKLREWSDCVLFAKYDNYTKQNKETKRVQGQSTGERKLYTTWSAAYDAKNRYSLPSSMPLKWSNFFDAVKAFKGK